MAARGLEVVGIDIAPRAIAKAQQKRDTQAQHGWAGSVIFADGDFLGAAPIPALEGAAFDLVFDRGVLHVFDDPARQALFAARVAELLGPGGHWLCLAGSTEGPPREQGPPRRSVRDIAQAIEPVLEIVELRAVIFDVDTPARAWSVLSRKRDVPAQPSSRRG
jgi:SAM-dependent methyltransferase